MQTRMKISEFARLTGVPQKTLRYYDEIGLFPPAEVDPDNGYRTYTPDQLPRLNQIMLYRSLGFPLEHILHLLQADVPPEQLRGMLRMRHDSARAQLEETRQRVEALEASLAEADDQVAFEARVAGYEVQVRPIEAVRVAAMRGEAPSLAGCGAVLGKLAEGVFKHVYKHGASPAGPGIALYHLFTETRVELEFALPVSGELPATARIGVYELPGIATGGVRLSSWSAGGGRVRARGPGALAAWRRLSAMRPGAGCVPALRSRWRPGGVPGRDSVSDRAHGGLNRKRWRGTTGAAGSKKAGGRACALRPDGAAKLGSVYSGSSWATSIAPEVIPAMAALAASTMLWSSITPP